MAQGNNTRAVTTPSPYRSNKPSPRRHLREQFEWEFWANFLGEIFNTNFTSNTSATTGNFFPDTTVNVPFPVAGRFYITGTWKFSTPGTALKKIDLQFIVDGNPVGVGPPRYDFVAGITDDTIAYSHTGDVGVGVHAIGIRFKNSIGVDTVTQLAVDFTIRRGRKPAA